MKLLGVMGQLVNAEEECVKNGNLVLLKTTNCDNSQFQMLSNACQMTATTFGTKRILPKLYILAVVGYYRLTNHITSNFRHELKINKLRFRFG